MLYRWFCFLCILIFTVLSPSSLAQNKRSISLYNLTPVTIDAIGMDGDLLYSLRNALESSQAIEVQSRRQMEGILFRIAGSQTADTATVVSQGQALGVNYVFTGIIDAQPGQIRLSLKIIDVHKQTEIRTWQEQFSNASELNNSAPVLAEKIIQSLASSNNAQHTEGASTAQDVLSEFNATGDGSAVALLWRLRQGGEPLYYNLYRSQSETGPFKFVSTVLEPKFVDSTLVKSGRYYYRVGVVLGDGGETQSSLLASIDVSKARTVAGLSPPTILTMRTYVNGVEVDFIPAISNQVKLSGYRLYQRQQQGWTEIAYIEEKGLLQYTFAHFNGFDPATEYQLSIVSVTADNAESSYSPPVSLTTAPNPILSLEADQLTRKVGLSWQGGDPKAIGAKLYRKQAGQDNWSEVAKITPLGENRFEDTLNLQDGSQYEYALSLFDQKAETAKSNIVLATTKPAPAPPTGLSVSSGVKSATLSWTANTDPDVKGYMIFRREGEMGKDDLLDEVGFVAGNNSTQFTDGVDNKTPLKDGTLYNYVLASVNVFDGRGASSPVVSVETKPRPEAVKQLEVVSDSDKLRLSWQPSSAVDIQSYHLYRQWPQQNWMLVTTIPADTTTYVDEDLKPYAQTLYKVVAEDRDGLLSDDSNLASITSPTKIELEVKQDDLLRNILLQWNTHSNIDGYRVYRRAKNSANWQRIAQIQSPQSGEYSDNDQKNLLDGTYYQYQVSAYDQVAETPPSNVVEGKTKDLPLPPGNIQAQSGQLKQVTLSWQVLDDADVEGYVIYKIDGNNKEEIESIKSRTTGRFVDKGGIFSKLTDGTLYQYQLAAFNRFRVEGPLSEPISATTKAIPSAVTGLSSREETLGDVSSVIVEWQPASETDIAAYDIYRGSHCSSVRKLARVSAQSLVYQDTSVAPGEDYCYKIQALDSDKLEGAWSEPSEISTMAKEGGN